MLKFLHTLLKRYRVLTWFRFTEGANFIVHLYCSDVIVQAIGHFLVEHQIRK